MQGLTRSFRLALLAVLLGAVLLVGLVASPPTARAASDCDLFASPQGSDADPGTISRPLRRVNTLVDRLQPGETGCLREGRYETIDDDLWIHTSRITLAGYGGERAVVRGHLAIGRDARGVTVKDLVLNGENSRSEASPFIGGQDATFRNNEVTNHHTSICFLLAGQGGKDYAIHNALIVGNLIHDCGELPATNHSHGIYLQKTRDAVVRDNVILDNADRGVQLYYDSQRTEVSGNVIDGNGQGIIVSGDKGAASSGNRIHNNVIANSVLRFNVEEYWPQNNPIGSDNLVYDNCLYSDSETHGGVGGNSGLMPNARGFSAYDNIFSRPNYVDRRQGRLRAGSACASVLTGPTSVGKVTMRSNRSSQRPGKRVILTGRAPSDARTVTILRRTTGNWKAIGRAKLRPNGSFRARERVRGFRRARFRATVPGIGQSPTVTVKVQRRR